MNNSFYYIVSYGGGVYEGSIFYSVFFDHNLDMKFTDSMRKVLRLALESREKEGIILGYSDILLDKNMPNVARIYHDIIDVEEENLEAAQNAVLNALNSIEGIKEVIINEEDLIEELETF